jgi:GT2 family glycosyltransferase
MKILYIKNNSERAKAFQLRTIIYELDGEKFIKKEAITPEAIPHLKKMRENYEALSKTIINPKVKLAKIIEEHEDRLTFEFIQGESLEKKFHHATTQEAKEQLFDAYIDVITHSFKTKKLSKSDITPLYKTLFTPLNFSSLEDEIAFDGVSNIDLIFSNIIYQDDNIYLIDYEWAFELSLPIAYIIHRTLEMTEDLNNEEKYRSKNHFLYLRMERAFIDTYVMQGGFYFQKHQYIKTNAHLEAHLEGKEAHIEDLKNHLEAKEEEITRYDIFVKSLQRAIELRDHQIAFLFSLTDTLRLKNKIRQFIPQKLLTLLGKEPYKTVDINNYPLPKEEDILKEQKSVTYNYQEPQLTPRITQELEAFSHQPLISIIMPVYNVDLQWIKRAIASLKKQWYRSWELCIADDKSSNQELIRYLKKIDYHKIKVTFLEKNQNISGASNEALKLATGEYISLLDNDDELTPDALYEMVKAINEKKADFIYSDEDFISPNGEYLNPHFKPNFSPDLLLSHNYITHFTCFKKSLLDEVGLFNSAFDGSQDYDLFLRLTERASIIHHIPKVLYHWRMLATSTASNSQAKPEAIERGKRVLEATLQRREIDATVEHANKHHYFRVKYPIKGEPLVSIIIPFKDRPELLEMSVSSVLEKSTYTNYEIIGISNNSTESKTFDMMLSLEALDERVSFYEYNTPFNYADINNHAVKTYAKGEHILLLNNDIEVISPHWIESMLEHSQRSEVGTVGAKLYYPNETIQHAGIIIGLGGYAAHSHREFPRDHAGYFNRLNIIQNLCAVTAACLMIKKSIYDEVEGMNSQEFKIGYNDVDFNLRVLEKGYYNIFTPYAELYHHESLSRGEDNTPEKIARFQSEKDALFARHREILKNGDPYYNPNLTHDKEDFSLCQR